MQKGLQKYDVVCVGAGMAGLATAALLSKAGKAVCLMDPADRVGGCVAAHEIEGFRFTAGPTITYGFEPGGILRKLFSALDLSFSATNSFPGYQVVMPEHRITVSGDPRETLEELVREFPDDESGLTRLYREIHRLAERSSKSRLSSYFLRQKISAAYLQSYRFGKDVIAYLDVQSRYFFGSSLQHLPLASFVLMLTAAPYYLHGGVTRLADQLLTAIHQRNGTWLDREPFPELLFRGNRITGIKTSRGIIEPRTVIFNVPIELPETIMFLGIRDEVLPVGMLQNVLCLAENEHVEDYHTLSLSAGDDKLEAPKGMRALTAAFPRAKGSDQSVESFMHKISPVVPFLQNYLISSSLQDYHARKFTFPPEVKVQSAKHRVGRPMLIPSSIKNLMIIPDSVRTLLPAVFTATAIAEKIK